MRRQQIAAAVLKDFFENFPDKNPELVMPPKKRVKKKPKDESKTKTSVPPKKRKLQYDSSSDEADVKKEPVPIPEWFKVSVQILLINFYQQGVAMLNCVQGDYEAVFKGDKVIPSTHGFADFESMLKSPQMAKHCIVYVEKRVPYCKGYPLPRSAVITMKGESTWEIDPKISKTMQEEKEKITVTESPKSPSPTVPSKGDESEPVEKNDAKQTTVPADQPESRLQKDFLNLKNKIRPHQSRRMPQLPIVSPDREVATAASTNVSETVKMSVVSSSEVVPGVPNSSSSTETEVAVKPFAGITKLRRLSSNEKLEGNANCLPPEIGSLKNANIYYDANFFRRSDVPPTWVNVQEGDDDVMIMSDEVVPPKSEHVCNLSISKSQENQKSEAEKPQKVLSTPSPPPPQLSPQVKFHRHMSERIKERRQMSNSYSNVYDDLDTDDWSSEEEENGPTSESTNCTAENLHSPNSTDTYSDEQSCCSSRVTELRQWCFTPVLLANMDPKHIIALKSALNNGLIQNPQRDPRLTLGTRQPHLGIILEDNENEKNILTNELNNGTAQNDGVQDDNGSVRVKESQQENPVRDTQSEPSTRLNSFFEPSTQRLEEGNLTVTIRNNNHVPERKNNDNRQMMSVPLRKVYQMESHLFIEDPIPIPPRSQAGNILKCEDLWANVKWKSRFDQDSVKPQRFFMSDVFDQWLEMTQKELSPSLQTKLMQELQKYEEKVYPSRCEYYLRSALRMVEIDYRTNQQFSEPKWPNGDKLVGPNEILYYVDFAGSPGGVVEYYQKVRKLSSKGFGVTYQTRFYDFRKLVNVHPEFFEAFYGKLNSYSGDGSLFCTETVEIFAKRVMEATNGKGVHIVSTVGNIARAVFDDENDEHWKFQHLAQIIVALTVLREGGNLAFKMYDLKKSFTVGLVYFLYQCFRSVRISKLNIFAPASNERVIICLGRKSLEETSEIVNFLQKCHKMLADWYTIRDKTERNRNTIEELIPLSVLEKQTEFMDYVLASNDRIKWTQLEELSQCMKNLQTIKSIFTRAMYRALVARTTELWKVPLRQKLNMNYFKTPDPRNPLFTFRELRVQPENVCEAVEAILNEFNLYTIFSTTEHWRFSPIGNKKKTRGFYLGVNGMPHLFNLKTKEWISVRDSEFRLPSKTLVYAEIVPLFLEDGSNSEEVFSIIDGYSLAGVNINHLTYAQRICECEKFSMAVTRTFFPRMIKLTVTKSFDFMQLPNFLEKIVASTPSNESAVVDKSAVKLKMPVASVLPLRGDSAVSKSYWFNPSGILFFEAGSKATDFCSAVSSRVYWEWVSGMDIPLPKLKSELGADIDTLEHLRPIGSVSAKKLIDFVNRYSVV